MSTRPAPIQDHPYARSQPLWSVLSQVLNAVLSLPLLVFGDVIAVVSERNASRKPSKRQYGW
jgi:hypothetical protein